MSDDQGFLFEDEARELRERERDEERKRLEAREDVPVRPFAENPELVGALFDLTPVWRRHWAGMPEYTHEDLTPMRSIVVHFESDADVAAFAKLVEQEFTDKTKSIWYPEAGYAPFQGTRYADES